MIALMLVVDKFRRSSLLIFKSKSQGSVYMDMEIYCLLHILRTDMNLVHWYTLKSTRPIIIFRSKHQWSRVKLDIGIYWPLSILRTRCLTDIKLGILIHTCYILRSRRSLLIFRLHRLIHGGHVHYQLHLFICKSTPRPCIFSSTTQIGRRTALNHWVDCNTTALVFHMYFLLQGLCGDIMIP
jgi:hypothetical protein